MKNEGLSYPTHFVKIGSSYIEKNLHALKNKTSQHICVTKCTSFIIHYENSKGDTQ